MRRINRQPQVEHVDSEGSWAISYGDMITLLMTFFVLYFTVDHKKERAVQMQDSLMVKLQEAGIEADKPALNQQLNIGAQPGEGIDPKIMQNLGARVHVAGRGLIVEFQNTSFFEIGHIGLNKEGQKALETFATLYTPYAGNYELGIQAYTDTRKVRAENLKYRDNLELSAMRSIASMRMLQKSGIPLNRMKISGYGELMETQEELLKNNKNADPLRMTRKVVLVIEPITERN